MAVAAEPIAFADVEIIAVTEKACLVDFGDRKEWIPYSCMDDDSAVWEKGDKGTVLIARWFAFRLGLTDEKD